MTFSTDLTRLAAQMEEAVLQASTADKLLHVEKSFLGRKGTITLLLQTLASAPAQERAELGKLANATKQRLATAVQAKRSSFGSGGDAQIDPTLPGLPIPTGHEHPLTQVIRKIVDIFRSMGYELVDGPEVELERYNFDLLNIPNNHPARDLQDTFYLGGGEHRVLRTHTSPVQVRAMEHRRPPVRLIVPGRVYRHEATDASHEAAFFQCEGLVIDKGIRLTDLFGTIDDFLKAFFGSEVVTRAQASYFPFVEPGAEIAMRCLICQGKGCSVCKKTGWLEMMGCGMVHPQVLKNMGVDPKVYSGFAFGMGLDRLMMLAHGITDVRLSYSGDVRFLKQF